MSDRLPSGFLILLAIVLMVCVATLAGQNATDAQKQEFIELLKTLPTKGEFYTEESVRKAGPYLPVLLSLTEKDLEKRDLYPFVAMSAGLSKDKQHRAYVLAHFTDIRHLQLKLLWGSALFYAGEASPEVVRYLRDALNERADLMAEMLGPDFKFFKRRVMSHPYATEGGPAQPNGKDDGHADWVVAVVFSPDGQTILSGSHDGTLIFWDMATGKQLRSIEDHRLHGKPFEIVSVAFSPDGKTVASASSDQTVRLWDASNGKPRRVFRNVKFAHEITFSPDGRKLAVANCERVMVWNLSNGVVQRNFHKEPTGVGTSFCAEHVAFSRDGRHVIADGGPIQIWSVATGRQIKRFEPEGSGFGMALSHDGARLLLGEDFQSGQGMIELWDVGSGKLLRRFAAEDNPVEAVAFSPDGKLAASESRDGDDIESDGFIKLWDLATGRELRRLSGHQQRVAAIAFAPDGKTLASGSWDRSVKLWDVATGQELRSFPAGKEK
jgi:tricorn protease-like protein